MPFKPFTYADHEATLTELAGIIQRELTEDERQFLLSFEAGEPDWQRFPIATLASLPAPQFKLGNFQKFREEQPERHAAGLTALKDVLSG